MEPHLLQAVLADPANDAVRLILADWLEEQGQADRAEFIRVQIKLARSNPAPALPENRELLEVMRQREMEFVRTRLHKVLREELPSGVHADFLRWEHPPRADQGRLVDGGIEIESVDGDWSLVFRCGFVAEASAPTPNFLDYGRALVWFQPIELVTLTNLEPVGPIEVGPNRGGWFYLRRDMGERLWRFLFAGRTMEREVATAAVESAEKAIRSLSALLLLRAKDAQVEVEM